MLDVTKFKAFQDDKFNIDKMMISVFNIEENTVGKGESAGYQHFLLFQQRFLKPYFLAVVKSRDCVVNS